VPDDDRPLRLAEQPSSTAVTARERLEQRVERPDGAGEKAALAANELALDPLDVGAVGDDEPGVTVDRVDETVEQRRDLPGVRRTDDEGETHRCMVVRRVSRPGLRPGRESRCERETERSRHAAPFRRGGRRPTTSGERLRLATAPCDRRAGHSARARIAEIGLFRATTCVVERHAKDGALSLADFGAAGVANENGLSGHNYLPM
jgi:hypothetical protein